MTFIFPHGNHVTHSEYKLERNLQNFCVQLEIFNNAMPHLEIQKQYLINLTRSSCPNTEYDWPILYAISLNIPLKITAKCKVLFREASRIRQIKLRGDKLKVSLSKSERLSSLVIECFSKLWNISCGGFESWYEDGVLERWCDRCLCIPEFEMLREKIKTLKFLTKIPIFRLSVIHSAQSSCFRLGRRVLQLFLCQTFLNADQKIVIAFWLNYLHAANSLLIDNWDSQRPEPPEIVTQRLINL